MRVRVRVRVELGVRGGDTCMGTSRFCASSSLATLSWPRSSCTSPACVRDRVRVGIRVGVGVRVRG